MSFADPVMVKEGTRLRVTQQLLRALVAAVQAGEDHVMVTSADLSETPKHGADPDRAIVRDLVLEVRRDQG